jgi:hypothetical protein
MQEKNFVKLNFNVAQYTIEQVSLSQIGFWILRRVYGALLLSKVKEYNKGPKHTKFELLSGRCSPRHLIALR